MESCVVPTRPPRLCLSSLPASRRAGSSIDFLAPEHDHRVAIEKILFVVMEQLGCYRIREDGFSRLIRLLIVEDDLGDDVEGPFDRTPGAPAAMGRWRTAAHRFDLIVA